MVNRRSSQIRRKSAFTLLSTEVSEELLEQDDKLEDAESMEHQDTNEDGPFAARPFDAVLVEHPTRRLSTFSNMSSITGSMISRTTDFSSLSSGSNLNGSLNGFVIEGLSSLRRNGATPKEVAAALEELLNEDADDNVSGSMISLDSLTSFVMRSGIKDSLNIGRTNNVTKIDAPPSNVTGQGAPDSSFTSHDISAALKKLFGDSSFESGDSMLSLDTLSSFILNGFVEDSVKVENMKSARKKKTLSRNRSGRRRGLSNGERKDDHGFMIPF